MKSTDIPEVRLFLYKERGKEILEIISFSMLETSTWHCRFKTKGGQVLESHGLPIGYAGNLDSLPSCAKKCRDSIFPLKV